MDFKFTSEVPETLDPFQLQLYALGLKETTGSTADTLSFYYLRQERKISFPGGAAAIQEGKERTAELAHQLQEDWSFSPKTGSWCGTCSYRKYCPAQREHPEPVPHSLVQARLPL